MNSAEEISPGSEPWRDGRRTCESSAGRGGSSEFSRIPLPDGWSFSGRYFRQSQGKRPGACVCNRSSLKDLPHATTCWSVFDSSYFHRFEFNPPATRRIAGPDSGAMPVGRWRYVASVDGERTNQFEHSILLGQRRLLGHEHDKHLEHDDQLVDDGCRHGERQFGARQRQHGRIQRHRRQWHHDGRRWRRNDRRRPLLLQHGRDPDSDRRRGRNADARQRHVV